MEKELEKPNIYNYLNYRDFLRDLVAYLKATKRAFSYRYFARESGLKSPNFLKFILDEKRNLTFDSIQKFAKGFKLKTYEKNYFENLVFFNQASTNEEKNKYFRSLSRSKNFLKIKKLENNQYQFFSHWYYVVLRELITMKDFKEDIDWINQKLQCNLSKEEIQEAIQTLINLKLIQRNKKGKLSLSDEKIVASPDMISMAINNFHREMIRKADQSLEGSFTEHRDISSLTIGINQKQFEKIRKKIKEFRRELHTIISENEDIDTIYQINFQLFNLTEVPWKEK